MNDFLDKVQYKSTLEDDKQLSVEPPSGEDMLDLTAAYAAVTTILHVLASHDFFYKST